VAIESPLVTKVIRMDYITGVRIVSLTSCFKQGVNKTRNAMRSVPSRGSVGSMFRRRILIGEIDPTLPRDGTDLMSLWLVCCLNLKRTVKSHPPVSSVLMRLYMVGQL